MRFNSLTSRERLLGELPKAVEVYRITFLGVSDMKKIYEVRLNEKCDWVRCWRAVELPAGKLRYNIAGHVGGIAAPHNWRIVSR